MVWFLRKISFFAEYTVFILPYNGDVIGTPSNLKVVVTKEDGMFKTLTIISNSVAYVMVVDGVQ